MSLNLSYRHFGARSALSILALCSISLSGCGETTPDSSAMTSEPSTTSAAHAEHDHPTEGPHHGDLVELGNEEFHAEVIHQPTESVTVYILDSSAKNAVSIDAADLAINVSNNGKAEQFKLSADRDAADPEGKSSRFSIKNDALAKILDDHDAAAKLVVMIDGKSYSGKITHSHDADHSHAHGHEH